MRWTVTRWLLIGAAASLMLTLIALGLPVYQAEYLEGPSTHYVYNGLDGALVGWLFVLGLDSPAWLANAPWIWSIARMFRGRAPNWVAAVAGPVLAATAYWPAPIPKLDRAANSYGEPMYGIAIWLVAQAIPLLALLCLHQRRTVAETQTDQRP